MRLFLPKLRGKSAIETCPKREYQKKLLTRLLRPFFRLSKASLLTPKHQSLSAVFIKKTLKGEKLNLATFQAATIKEVWVVPVHIISLLLENLGERIAEAIQVR